MCQSNICAVLVWLSISIAALGNKIKLYFSYMEHYYQLLYVRYAIHCVRTVLGHDQFR